MKTFMLNAGSQRLKFKHCYHKDYRIHNIIDVQCFGKSVRLSELLNPLSTRVDTTSKVGLRLKIHLQWESHCDQ